MNHFRGFGGGFFALKEGLNFLVYNVGKACVIAHKDLGVFNKIKNYFLFIIRHGINVNTLVVVAEIGSGLGRFVNSLGVGCSLIKHCLFARFGVGAALAHRSLRSVFTVNNLFGGA